jgi:hypothetical protein
LWWNVSVYYLSFTFDKVIFHLYRHVAKTGDIKDFVVTEESGIAKGIRRIVAVTGHEAQEVMRVAQGLSEKLATIDASSGKAKDAALRAMNAVRFLLLPSSFYD